jgi:hypothetical protein
MNNTQLYATASDLFFNVNIYGFNFVDYLGAFVGNTNNNNMTLIGIEKYLLDSAELVRDSNDPSLLIYIQDSINQVKDYIINRQETEQLSNFRTHIISQATNCINRDRAEIIEDILNGDTLPFTFEEVSEITRVLRESNWIITRED